MKRTLVLIALALMPLSSWSEQYGEDLSGAEPLPVAEAIRQLEDQSRASVVVRGTVGSVCQAKGCWMGLSSEAGDVRVTFKDYAFFVPFTVVGKTVVVKGQLEKVRLSLAESKHMVEDAGGDPDQVVEPLVEYRLVATGVNVES